MHPASMAGQFWKLGLPVEAKDRRVSFAGGREKYEIFQEGWELTVEQCKILVHMGMKLAIFRIGLVCHWEKEDGTIKEF
jgi:mRNA turnover protein 4